MTGTRAFSLADNSRIRFLKDMRLLQNCKGNYGESKKSTNQWTRFFANSPLQKITILRVFGFLPK